MLIANDVQGIGLKLKLLKAKLVAGKALHFKAKAAVAAEVKAKTAVAFAKSVAAVRTYFDIFF